MFSGLPEKIFLPSLSVSACARGRFEIGVERNGRWISALLNDSANWQTSLPQQESHSFLNIGVFEKQVASVVADTLNFMVARERQRAEVEEDEIPRSDSDRILSTFAHWELPYENQ